MANVDDLGAVFTSLVPLIAEHGPTIASKIFNYFKRESPEENKKENYEATLIQSE